MHLKSFREVFPVVFSSVSDGVKKIENSCGIITKT